MNNKKGKNNMENKEQILQRAQDRKMLEAIFKTIENQKVNIDASKCSNELLPFNQQLDENQNNIFNKDTTFGQALQIFHLTIDKNLISNIRQKHLKYHPDKNNGDTKDIDKLYALNLLNNKAQIIQQYGNSDFSKFLNTLLSDITEDKLKHIYLK